MATGKAFELGDVVMAPMAFHEHVRGTAEHKAQLGEQLDATHPKHHELVLQAREAAERNLRALLRHRANPESAATYIPIVTATEAAYETDVRESKDGFVYAVTATLSATGAMLPSFIETMDPDAFNRWWWRLHHGPVPPVGGFPPPVPPPAPYPIPPPPAAVAGGLLAVAVIAIAIAIWELNSGGPTESSGTPCGDTNTHRMTRVHQDRSWGARRSLRNAIEAAEAECSTLSPQCVGGCPGGRPCNSVPSIQTVAQTTGFSPWTYTTITFKCPCECQ